MCLERDVSMFVHAFVIEKKFHGLVHVIDGAVKKIDIEGT